MFPLVIEGQLDLTGVGLDDPPAVLAGIEIALTKTGATAVPVGDNAVHFTGDLHQLWGLRLMRKLYGGSIELEAGFPGRVRYRLSLLGDVVTLAVVVAIDQMLLLSSGWWLGSAVFRALIWVLLAWGVYQLRRRTAPKLIEALVADGRYRDGHLTSAST